MFSGNSGTGRNGLLVPRDPLVGYRTPTVWFALRVPWPPPRFQGVALPASPAFTPS